MGNTFSISHPPSLVSSPLLHPSDNKLVVVVAAHQRRFSQDGEVEPLGIVHDVLPEGILFYDIQYLTTSDNKLLIVVVAIDQHFITATHLRR